MKNLNYYCFLVASLMSFAQPAKCQEYVEDFSYISDEVIRTEFGLPVVRKVYGGTKIIPEFEGNWTNEMKGAFEFACKIWEEAMPTTFPIKLMVVLDETTTAYQNKPVFSKVNFLARSHTNDSLNMVFSNKSTYMQIKGATFHEFSRKSDTETYYGILYPSLFEEPDATIRYYNYNNKLVDNCSFSLENEPDANYYDFVTLALRDIAKAFGIVWSNRAVRNETLTYNPSSFIPFEQWIANALNSGSDYSLAYKNATKGSLTIGHYDTWTLYAPTEWDTDRSLNYFIPEEGKKITRLMSYDFGRGTMIRDIACLDTRSFFEEILRWTGDIAVGDGGHSAEVEFDTDKTIPYKGSISVSSNANTMSSSSVYDVGPVLATSGEVSDEVWEYMAQFHPNNDGTGDIDNHGWRVALLKKDGTWDIVYNLNGGGMGYFTVSTSQFVLHDEIENYARSCDGYLRCRVTHANEKNPQKSTSYYYLLDYLPQQLEVSMSKVMPYESEESYYRDVKIGLKNIEGATSVIVSQLDEGNELPYQYEVIDFKKGYFIATVDKDFTSTFTVTAYNNNGSTASKPYVLKPLSLQQNFDVEFTIENNTIFITPTDESLIGQDLFTTFEITKLLQVAVGNNLVISGEVNSDGAINIWPIPKGMYVLVVTDIYGGKHSLTFTR